MSDVRDALTALFYEAITVAHGEGEAYGRGRARMEGPTEHDAMSYGDMAIGGTTQPRPPVPPGLVGFSINDRRELAAEYASRAARTAAGLTTGAQKEQGE